MKNTAPCTHGEWQKLPSMACTVYHRMGHSTMNQQPHVGVSVAGQALASGCGKWLCARVTMMPLDAVVLSSTCGWPPVPCTMYVQGTGHQPTPAVLVLIQYCYFWDSKELTIPCSTKRLASSLQTLRVVQAGTSGTRLSSVHTLHTIYLPTPHFHPRLPPFNSKSQSPTSTLTLPSPPLPPTHPLSDEALCQSGRHSAGWPERESP